MQQLVKNLIESLGKVYRRIEDLSGAAARTGKFTKQVKNKYYERSKGRIVTKQKRSQNTRIHRNDGCQESSGKVSNGHLNMEASSSNYKKIEKHFRK